MKRAPRSVSYAVFYEQASEGGYVAFVPALLRAIVRDANLSVDDFIDLL